jgi:hypothetical protein
MLAGDDRQLAGIKRGGILEPLRTTYAAAEKDA